MKAIESILFVQLALLGIICFQFAQYFPIWFSIIILVGVTLYLRRLYVKKRVGVLVLLIWLVYSLPYIHVPPYLFYNFNSQPLILWGLAVRDYMLDEQIIKLMAMIGAVGALGIAFGASLSHPLVQKDTGVLVGGEKKVFSTLSVPIWLMWVIIGLGLTALSSPEDTVFTSAYTQGKSVLDGANFSSAWMVSYVILSYAFCDSLLEIKRRNKQLKIKLIAVTVLIVLLYFQLMRGDRAAVPWVFGLALVYYYWTAGITQKAEFNIPWSKIALVAFLLLAVSQIVGVMRSGLVGATLADVINLLGELYDSDSIGLANALHGTWSAVLLTPLSVAGDYVHEIMEFKWGLDYLNLILSIIPGFIADAIGYIRPIDAYHGPAWEMTYGIGGTHAVVLPFRNFGMVGVFLIPATWMYLVVRLEKYVLRNISVPKLALLTTIAASSAHWLWYGEKYGMNAIIIWGIFLFFYRVSLSRQSIVMNLNSSLVRNGS